MKTDPNKDATGAPLPWVFDGDFVVVDFPRGSYPIVCRPLCEADGNVIAAAPQVYCLLDRLYNHILSDNKQREVGIDPGWYEETRRALAKARGEPEC
jgi:hypothetical protein